MLLETIKWRWHMQKKIGFMLIFVIVCGWYLLQLPTDTNPRYSTPAMINGTADKPFVTRALVPMLLNIIPVIPLSGITLYGWLFAMRLLARETGNTFERKHEVGALLGLLPFFLRIAHLGDLMTLLLTTLCLASLVRVYRYGRHGNKEKIIYLFLFALATINRETSIMLIIVSLIYTRDVDLTVEQIVTFVVLRGAIMFAFAGNGGAPFELHWGDQLERMVNSYDLTILSVCVVVLLLSRLNIRSAHPLMRTAFTVFAPTLAVMYFVVGYPFEFRVLLEVYPVVLLMKG